VLNGESMSQCNDAFSGQVREVLHCLGINDCEFDPNGTGTDNLIKELNRPQGLGLGALALCMPQSNQPKTEKALKNIQLVQVVLSRFSMNEPEAWAFARLCGDHQCGPESPPETSFHAELRRIIQKYQLWRFFNASGPGIEHRAIVPSAYDSATGDVLPSEMAEWRAAYRDLSPARQMMVATIVWLYRGCKDSIWLRRVPVAWGVVEAVTSLRSEGLLLDWGVLLARYPGW